VGLRPELFDAYLDLACEFSLPIRLADSPAEAAAGFPLRSLAEQEGILSPDRTMQLNGDDRKLAFAELVSALEPGVTELAMQPAIDTPELHALGGDTAARIGDHHVLLDPASEQVVADAGVHLISWAAIRTLQRAAS